MFDALVMGGASLLGGMMGSSSAKKAAAAQARAAEEATAEQRRQFDINRADLAPFREAGASAMGRLSYLMGLGNAPGVNARDISAIEQELRASGRFRIPGQKLEQYQPQLGEGDNPATIAYRLVGEDGLDEAALKAEAQRVFEAEQAAAQASMNDPEYGSLTKKFTVSDFWNDPVVKLGHEFGLNEGTKALDRMRGAAGMRNSGATLKALTRFGNDYTGTKAGESRDRFVGDQTNIYNRLAGISGSGQTAATQGAQLGQQTATNIGNIATGLGNARGASAIASGNAWNNAFSTIGNWWTGQSTLDKVLNRGGTAGYGGMSSTPFAGSFGGMNT